MANIAKSCPSSAQLDQAPAHNFDEPWQADAFATIVHLSRSGAFGWNEWVQIFSAEIAAHPQRDGETVSDAYYRQWLRSVETVVGKYFGIQATSISARQSRWREAYLHTRHGSPVLLSNAPFGDDADYADSETESEHHDHHHSDHHGQDSQIHPHSPPKTKPIAVSPALTSQA
jgi:nitrile hydratase accessory protein